MEWLANNLVLVAVIICVAILLAVFARGGRS